MFIEGIEKMVNINLIAIMYRNRQKLEIDMISIQYCIYYSLVNRDANYLINQTIEKLENKADSNVFNNWAAVTNKLIQ